MEASRSWDLPRTCVQVIDREGDAVQHLRAWDAAGARFLVRANNRRVQHEGQSCQLVQIVPRLAQSGSFTPAGEVQWHGTTAQQWVAETELTLTGPGWERAAGRKYRVPGRPLRLRLVVAQVRDASEHV
jgi:hypothetical protein